jgi:hypothetical protein
MLSISFGQLLVSSIHPDHASTNGGELVTVHGQGFHVDGAVPTVYIGSKICTGPSVLNDRQLKCFGPSGVGTGKHVVVSVQGKTSAATDKVGATISHYPERAMW